MDGGRRLQRGVSVVDRPGPRLVGSGGEEDDEAKQPVAEADDALQAGFGQAQVRSLPDAVAQALEMHLGMTPSPAAVTGNGHAKAAALPAVQSWTGNLCAQCGCNTLVYEEGCKKCHACGYSEC